MTGRDQTLLEQEIVVAKLNRTMIGWANYFCLGPVSKALSGSGKPRLQEAAPVVVCQAQSNVGHQEDFRGIPVRRAGSRPPYQTDAHSPVGDIVTLSPRAGSGKSAYPVR
jgi:hypothetical protein